MTMQDDVLRYVCGPSEGLQRQVAQCLLPEDVDFVLYVVRQTSEGCRAKCVTKSGSTAIVTLPWRREEENALTATGQGWSR